MVALRAGLVKLAVLSAANCHSIGSAFSEKPNLLSDISGTQEQLAGSTLYVLMSAKVRRPPARGFAMPPSSMATLFAFAGWKRKAEASSSEVDAAKQEKKDQEKQDLAALAASAAAKAITAQPVAAGKQNRQYSVNTDAVRKRLERARKKRHKKQLQLYRGAGSSAVS